ncbi:MAG: ABC transporter ATP-binding protein [Nitrososphaerales archaeon]
MRKNVISMRTREGTGRLLPYVMPHKRLIARAVVFMSVATAFNLLVPWITGTVLIDEVIVKQNLTLLPWVVVGLLGVVLISRIFSYLQDYDLALSSQRAIHDLRMAFYDHLQHLHITFFEKSHTGDLVSRVTNDVDDIDDMITHGATVLGVQIIMLIGGFIALFYLNFTLTLLVLITFPILGAIVRYSRKRIRAAARIVKATTGEMAARAEDTISGMRIVKAFTREKFEVDRFSSKSLESMRANVRSTQIWSFYGSGVEMVTVLGTALVIWFAVPSVVDGTFTIGQLVAYLAYLSRMYNPILGLSRLNLIIQRGMAAAERLFEVIDVKKENSAQRSLVLPETKGRFVFEDASFGYDPERLVLKKFNLVVEPGEVVALVGRSGAGKSTIANLITGFYELTSGSIKLDGYPLHKLRLDSLRSQIGLVLQETFLFSGTVKENILYGKLDATEKDLVKATKTANAHDFIMNLSHGYDTEIGEKGVKLSGGERQRIAIARALLKDPGILILDEATSNLDSESEALIQQALDVLIEGRTTFIIAHRLSTVRKADKIVVIEDGGIVEIGTHAKLLKTKGPYRKFYETQFIEQKTR